MILNFLLIRDLNFSERSIIIYVSKFMKYYEFGYELFF